MSDIQIAIADSQYLMRLGMRTVVQSTTNIHVVAETDKYDQLPELLFTYQPDVCIIGINQHTENPVEIVKQMVQHFEKTRILIVDTLENPNEVISLLQTGVQGYILKQCDRDEIIQAIESIHTGRNFYCSNVIRLNSGKIEYNCSGHTVYFKKNENLRLSNRELEVLKLIAEGYTNYEIADKIFVSSHTVATHRKNLMKKFQARNNVDLVISAIKDQLITP
ncbi:MAG: response regulator transcription factor [Flavobacteriales bacterium]|nr:response regulator transcription factor [Flavobacteriales bacterium]